MSRPRVPLPRPVRGPPVARLVPLLSALLVAPACGSAAARMPVDVPSATAPSPESLLASDVGRLLGGDPAASRDALETLASLDAAGRTALAAHAARIPNETDPRWLEVLASNGLAPALSPEQRLAWALWQVTEPEPGRVMAGQARLVELGRTSPGMLVGRLASPGPGRDALALALAEAGRTEAVPALLGLYRAPARPRERRAAALALRRLTGDAASPREEGTPEEIEADAARVEAWGRARDEAVDAKRSS